MGVLLRRTLSRFALLAVTLLGAFSPAVANADTGTFPGGGVTQADLGTFAVPYPSEIVVGGLNGPVSDVNVAMNDFDTNGASSNLDWLLVGPGGQHVIIVSDVGGANAASNVNLTLDDAAASFLPTASALASGTFKPTPGADGPTDDFNMPAPASPHGQLLSDFNGATANGTWSLYATDDFFMQSTAADIDSWSLTIDTTPVVATPAPTPTVTPPAKKKKCKKKKRKKKPAAAAKKCKRKKKKRK